MIDWVLARRVGAYVAGDPPGGVQLAGDLEAVSADARERVALYTELDPMRAIPAPEAVDRKAWLEANLTSMRTVLQPLAEKLDRPGGLGSAGRAIGALVAGAEVGGLLGLISQRVLGQYDLVLLDPSAPERLLFVAPNLREAAERLEVDEAELVRWVAIHEMTHAVQFTSVPWLRDHLGGLLRSLLESVDVKFDLGALLRLPSPDDVRGLVDRVNRGGLITLAAGPERMALLDQIQAAMAVVEGHAEHVMDAVGDEVLDSLPDLRAALNRRRREKPPVFRLLEKLLGLEMKMRQYEQGRAFCDAVVETGGIAALNRVWSGPGALPTLGELEAPDRWLERTTRRAA
jgi:coenzyme F420 biosynthesis associated uncharacterized protein